MSNGGVSGTKERRGPGEPREPRGQWEATGAGVLRLPSGRLVRGRGLRAPVPPPGPEPAFGVYLLGRRPPATPWESRWIVWPDFRLPKDREQARAVLLEAWRRAPYERVEIACAGGRGRTGTALACLAVLDGVPPHEAVAYVRRHYDRRAVETPWQGRYVRRFRGLAGATRFPGSPGSPKDAGTAGSPGTAGSAGGTGGAGAPGLTAPAPPEE